MLYDKRWDKTETKPDVFSLESLIAWLETMPTNKPYDFNDCDGACLLGQYMASANIPWSMGAYHRLADVFSGRVGLHAPIGLFPIGHELPHTFGAALRRARAAL